MGDQAPDKQVNKTKLLLSLKTDITDIQQTLDDLNNKYDKLQKRQAQVGPALDNILNHFIFYGI